MLGRTLMAGALSLAGTGNALAQAVVVEPPPTVYIVPQTPPAPQYYEYYEYAPAPRVHRYYRYQPADDDDLVVVLPRGRNGCGPSHYWDGRRCIYVRW